MRKEAYEAIRNDVKLDIVGSDKDPQAVKYSVLNAKAAGVDEDIVFSLSNLTNFNTNARRGSIITNPPYGERLEDEKSTKELYKLMSEKFSKYVGFDKNIITSFEGFESVFGKKADKNRKLFNGKIKAYYYQYYGEK
jgi:putative N6-adenine-specific DNA methylase